MPLRCTLATLIAILAGAVHAGDPTTSKPDEPLAKMFSFERARGTLDAMSLHWIEQHKCGSCHTTYPYLMVRPALKDPSAQEKVRAFLEKRSTSWDSGKKEDRPRGDTEIVATAAVLA